MPWYVVYKGKSVKGSLAANLEAAGITYFIPTQTVEHLEGNRMVPKVEVLLNNLIFIQTDKNILEVADAIDGLKAPYRDRATGKVAIIQDEEMLRFKKALAAKSVKAQLLQDSYKRFAVGQKVHVKAGDFEGLEGYVFRIKGDRKLVISLADMAIAISGIHHTLFEPIE